MRYIAHRGNTEGVKKNLENSPEYVEQALADGFDCEVDVWYMNGTWRLGHDGPQYGVSLDWLYKPGLWLHCKNIQAYVRLTQFTTINAFWHQEDDYTLTTQRWIWCYPGKNVPSTFKTVCVKPEIYDTDWTQFGAVCSDYVRYHRDQISSV